MCKWPNFLKFQVLCFLINLAPEIQSTIFQGFKNICFSVEDCLQNVHVHEIEIKYLDV